MDSQNWMFEGATPSNMHQFQEGFLNFDSPGTHSEHRNASPAHAADSPANPQHQSTNSPASHTPSSFHPSAATSSSAHPQYDYLASGHAIDMLDASLNSHHDAAIFTAKDEIQHWPAMTELQDIDMAEMDHFLPQENHGSLVMMQKQQQQQHQQQQQLHQSQSQHQQHLQNGNDNAHSNGHSSIPPTPSSFEVNSFNLSSHYSPALGSEPNGSIRPDVVFTPLVSPAVTPLDAMNRKHSTSANTAFFSPLTSPALEAKSPLRTAKKSSSEEKSKKYAKRKTPGSTPIVGPTVPGRIAKNSPVLKAKRSSSYANNMMHQQNSSQQQFSSRSSDFSRSPDSPDSIMAPPKTTSTTATTTSSSSSTSTTNGSALRRTRTQSNASLNQPATPATLMSIKLESSTNLSTSPVILPSNDNISRRSSTSTLLGKNNVLRTIPPDTSSASRTNNDDEEDLHTKKASHKLAEQGRRNRMNQAIADLGTMIPDELQQTVSIPSKATTVELASEYILRLENEVRNLRERLRQQGSDLVSNESISPLETTDHN